MTEDEAIDLLLLVFEGLDIVAEQMDLLACVFGEQELPSDEVGQKEN